jgi:hypothetical protein
MKKRFSSLYPGDMAAWMTAAAVYSCLAAAGLMTAWLHKGEWREPVASKPKLTPGI